MTEVHGASGVARPTDLPGIVRMFLGITTPATLQNSA
jgi:hypothetical protein